ncbi:MAG TPA: methyltransferase domain-containing protein [Thermoleophilaceae bacterium]|nr:methyltransferase domain-containing protein [Thermoleophilaceae bacterium]
MPEDRGPAPVHLAEFVRGLGPAGDVLDLGTGDGLLGAELAADRLVLADTSRTALERAARRLPDAAVVPIEPDSPLPFADSAFDLVVCVHVLSHVRDVQLFLSESRRVLRPGGRLAVATTAHGRGAGLSILARGFEPGFNPLSPHLRFFTRRSLARVLDELGFEVQALRRGRGDLLAVARR